jgi:hypothetical protein
MSRKAKQAVVPAKGQSQAKVTEHQAVSLAKEAVNEAAEQASVVPAVATGTSWTPDQEARVVEIIRDSKVTRAKAIQQMRREEKAKASVATPAPATPVNVAQATVAKHGVSAQIAAATTGTMYGKLAGGPKRQQVEYVFGGKKGWDLSWVKRAVILGITPEELCQQFKDDPEGLKERFAAVAPWLKTATPAA